LGWRLHRQPNILNDLRQSLPEVDGKAHIGAVVFIRRFDALLNAHLHFRVIVFDGVPFGEDAKSLSFQEARLTLGGAGTTAGDPPQTDRQSLRPARPAMNLPSSYPNVE
jgi:hypothetical protein